MPEPIESPPGAKGIQASGLAGPIRNLAAEIAEQAKYASPLRIGLSAAERAAHARGMRQRDQERERRVTGALEAAGADWVALRGVLAGNRPALAALDVHQPVRGYERAVCSECREYEDGGAGPSDWPCGTYTAIKGVA